MSQARLPAHDQFVSGIGVVGSTQGDGVGDMIAIDFDPDGLRIEPCRCCPGVWWAELVLVGVRVQLREWHRAECQDWADGDLSPVDVATPFDVAVPVRRGDGFEGLLAADGWDSDDPSRVPPRQRS